MLRVGVIGLGVGEQHLAAYRASGRCRVAALCDLSASTLARVGRAHRGALLTRRAEDVIGNPAVDAVSIASFDDDHFEQALGALKAGQHVFVEKPLCQTLEQARALKRAWERRRGRVKLLSNLVLRAAPLYRWLRREVRAGRFGSLYAFDGDYLYGRLSKITEGWRRNVKDYSVMQGGGVHLVDLLLWLTGQRPKTVSAAGNRIASRGTAFRYNDYAAATVRFGSGLVARITANFGCVHRHQHALRVFGTRRTFLFDDAGARLHASRNPAARPRRLSLAPKPASKGALIGDFVSAALEDRDVREETQSFFDGISVCAASDRALATGREQEVRYL